MSSNLADLQVYCADVGSIKNRNFGWAGRSLSQPNQWKQTDANAQDIQAFVAAILADLEAGRPLAVGFEAPLFVPVKDDPRQMADQRAGEEGRPWSAGAGAAVLTTGLVQTLWVLRQLRKGAPQGTKVYLAWPSFQEAGRGIFLWEAFVSKESKPEDSTHELDARYAVDAFCEAYRAHGGDVTRANAVDEPEVFSLIGAAVARAGWVDGSQALELLATPCLVIRP